MNMFVCLFFVFAVAQAEIDWTKHVQRNISEQNNPRIIGGEEAKPHQFPWMAYLQIRKTPHQRFYCGGSLISKNWILTGAYCIVGAQEAEIILGAHDKTHFEKGQIRMVSKVFIVHDIGLIGLPEPVELSERIQPVRLPSRSDVSNTFAGTLATVSGWGRTSDGFASKVLRFVQIPIISNEECGKSVDFMLESFLCTAGKTGKGFCIGDSGGPLVVEDKTQVGIVSFGSRRGCASGNPQVYTRITSYLDWIEKNTDVVIY